MPVRLQAKRVAVIIALFRSPADRTVAGHYDMKIHPVVEAIPMQGKTVVITGATSGIGEVTACSLAQQGARIVLVARDRGRAQHTLERLNAIAPERNHAVHFANLSRLAEMKRAAETIAASEARIDVLINNAGALFVTRQVTGDALEMTFATNHIAYFVVTNLLMERLKATPGARIVSTASDAHKGAKLDFDDLQVETGFSGYGMYGRSKLMNILFTRELSRRLAGSGVTANCLHPGFVATRFAETGSGLRSLVVRGAKKFALTPEEGAKTIIYLASSPEVDGITGKYFYKCKEMTPTAEAQNDADAQKLWEISLQLSGLGG
jgi:NAD(P)-dependent dehydrogenase (short-subunit alcohol dehydrogenase family)